MVNWSSIHAGTWWPLLLAFAWPLALWAVWVWRRGTRFPDNRLVKRRLVAGGAIDNAPLLLGALINVMLMLALMDLSVFRTVDVEKQSRDFLVVVDTSRSMRENTTVLREQYPPSYERRADLYAGRSDDPSKIPNLARYEIARESLLQYLSARADEDRVGLIYFNSMVHLMSGFTSNFDFIEQQLADMDSYVTHGTNIRWALEIGLDLMSRYPGHNKRALILLTDAEARNTDHLQEQLERMRRLDITFYLLWITADSKDGESPRATEFLRNARMLGSVYTIDDVGEGYLNAALDEIADLEGYAYADVRHERVDLSRFCLELAKVLILIWVLLMGTLYLPLKRIEYAGREHSGDA